MKQFCRDFVGFMLFLYMLILAGWCMAGIARGAEPIVLIGRLPGAAKQAVTADAAPTPYAEVVRVIGLLPKPAVGFVDFGCGPDARWCIVAAERWGCRATGIEIDPSRAAAARERVRAAGLEHLITIVTGDAVSTDVPADVGVAYLYADTLARLKPRIEKLRSFASYIHQPPVPAVKNGDTWIYSKPVQARGAVWNGQVYSGPVCNNPNCGMCNAIRAELQKQSQSNGRWVMVKRCNGVSCWWSREWQPD